LATNYRKIIATVTIEERIVRIKGVRNRAAHFDFHWQRAPRSDVTGRGQGGELPPGKLNVKTGPPLVDILVYLVFFRLLFFGFFGVFSFY